MANLRNKVYRRLQDEASFTHRPTSDKLTVAIRQLDEEGILKITDNSRFDHEPNWRIERGVNW